MTIKFTNENGFTVRDFAKAVYEGYTKIYAEEEMAAGDPGPIGDIGGITLLNRAPSDGP